MNVGEVWIHKKREEIQLKIIKYLRNDQWRVIYINTYGEDGSPYDTINGEVIFKYFYLFSAGEKEA